MRQELSGLSFSFPVLPVTILFVVCFFTSAVIQKCQRLLFFGGRGVLSTTTVPKDYQMREVLGAIHRL